MGHRVEHLRPNHRAALWIIVGLHSDRDVTYFGEALNLEKSVKARPDLRIPVSGTTKSYQEPTGGERAAQFTYFFGKRIRYHRIGKKVA